MCACIRAIGYSSLVSCFFPSFRGRVTPSLSLHKQKGPSPRKLDFLLVTTSYPILSLHPALRRSFVDSVVSLRLFHSPLAVRVGLTSRTFVT